MAVRPTIACVRCGRCVEADRATWIADTPYCSWSPCAKAAQQRLAGQQRPAGSAGGACGWCGQPLPASRDPRMRYCDGRCQRAASRARLATPAVIYSGVCGVCGAAFTSRQPSAKFCSRGCAVAAANVRRWHDPAQREEAPRPRTETQRAADAEKLIAAIGPVMPDLAGAACATGELDPDAWFAYPLSEPGQAALAACAGCPVRQACLSWALGLPDASGQGILGGMSQTRLRRERARRRLAAASERGEVA